MLQQMGFKTINRSAAHYGLSLILGGAEATLWDVTNAYAQMGRILSNSHSNDLPQEKEVQILLGTEEKTVSERDGSRKVTSGKTISRKTTSRKDILEGVISEGVISAGAAWLTLSALTEVNRPEEIDWKSIPSMQAIAWKTGTSYGFRDAWAVGVTPRYAVGVWVGNATGEGKPGLVGAQTAGPVLFDIFNYLPSSPWFERPTDVFVDAEICRQSGHLKGRFCEETDTVLILPVGLRTEACPYHHLVTLSADESHRIYENCANTEPTIQKSWFALPPVWEWYYKQHHPEYKPLPPFKAGCGEDSFQPMQFIYPPMKAAQAIGRQQRLYHGGTGTQQSQCHYLLASRRNLSDTDTGFPQNFPATCSRQTFPDGSRRRRQHSFHHFLHRINILFYYLCRMKQPLKENGGLPASILWTLAIVAGVSVANIYYIQPLLNMIRHELGISEFRTNLIAMVTQIGYAAGLLFITPLGDLYQRKKIILVNFTVLIFSLLTIALTHNFHLILIASFLTGVCSMIPQIFIPIAAQFSRPENKGRNVGIVLSGLLTGILASRVVSGFIGELIGWREMYHIAAGMMFICAIVVLKVLPDIQTNFQGKYSGLMKSLLALVKEYPQLRIYSIRAALNFGSLLAMWSCLAFKMGQAPFFANSDVIGMLGLCGVAGALTASFVGRYVKQVGVRRFNFIGCGLILFAWLLFFIGENTFIGIIAGIIIIDIGMQCIQLSNQTSIFELDPRASNRINTVFMTTYFIGGSMGTFLAGSFWQLYGWHGVIGTGVVLTGISLLITTFYKK